MVASRDSAAAGGSTTFKDSTDYVIRSKSSTGNTFTITKSPTTGFSRSCSIVNGSPKGGCSAEGASW